MLRRGWRINDEIVLLSYEKIIWLRSSSADSQQHLGEGRRLSNLHSRVGYPKCRAQRSHPASLLTVSNCMPFDITAMAARACACACASNPETASLMCTTRRNSTSRSRALGARAIGAICVPSFQNCCVPRKILRSSVREIVIHEVSRIHEDGDALIARGEQCRNMRDN